MYLVLKVETYFDEYTDSVLYFVLSYSPIVYVL